jgi:hypothetical protein
MIASAVPFSGGTSLEGNFAAPYGGMSIDFTHMDRVLDFHEDEYAPLNLYPCYFAGRSLVALN